MDVVIKWMLNAGWSEHSARDVLLLLMVLFENVHVRSSRSETKSALKPSPLRSPILLASAIGAFVVYLTMMYRPFLHAILNTERVGPGTWVTLSVIALGFFVLVQLHNRAWRFRRRLRPWPASKPDSLVSP